MDTGRSTVFNGPVYLRLDQLEDSLEDSDSAQLESKMPEKKEIENADQQTSENDAADENELDIF